MEQHEEKFPRELTCYIVLIVKGINVVRDESTVANLCYEDLPLKKETLEPAYLSQCLHQLKLKVRKKESVEVFG